MGCLPRQERACEVCNEPFRASYRDQRTCGRACGVVLRGQVPGGQPVTRRDMSYQCKFCRGNFDESPRPGVVRQVCPGEECQAELRAGLARRWAQDNPDRIREASGRRRFVKAGSAAEPIDLLRLADRDRWRCGICSRAVDGSLRWPDPMSPSVDHIVPLSEQGDHNYANTRLAHLRCNVSRGNRGGNEQLVLIG